MTDFIAFFIARIRSEERLALDDAIEQGQLFCNMLKANFDGNAAAASCVDVAARDEADEEGRRSRAGAAPSDD